VVEGFRNFVKAFQMLSGHVARSLPRP
jgi:hypothetical protein